MNRVSIHVLFLLLVGLYAAAQADAPIRSSTNKEWLPAVAYNDDDHEYMVVWSEYIFNGAVWMNWVMAQRAAEDGTLLGSAFVVYPVGVNPIVTYNSSAHEYIVGFNPGGGYVGQRVSRTGSPIGTPTTLMNGVSNGRLLYNSITGQYLFVGAVLVETPSGSGYYNLQVSTCKIGLDGQQLNSPQGIVNVAHGYNTAEPAFGAAFAPVQSSETPYGRYLLAIGRGLVLYMLNSDGAVINIVSDPYHPGVYYREVPFSAGSPTGGEFHVDVAYGDQSSYSMTGPAFLVVWADQNNKWDGQSWSGIWGEFLDATKIAYLTTDTVRNDAFPVSAIADHWAYDQHVESWKPRAAYNPSSQKFFVVWRETPGTSPYNNATVNHIRGNYVFEKVPADNVVISATSGTEDPQRPAVAASTTSEHALVVWEDSRNLGSMNLDIYGSVQKVCDAVTPPVTNMVVTNTLDTGPGSFRQAILNANAHSGKDTISFNIPGAGPHTIMPVTALPALTEPVIIDGFTQPGSNPNTNALKNPSNATLKIVLDGSLLAGVQPPSNGLRITGGNSCIRGFVVNSFPADGVVLEGIGGNVVEGCYLGTDNWGLVRRDNWIGLLIDSVANNVVGGTTAAARNVISGNKAIGVLIMHAGSTGNLVQGNYVGVDASGNAALGNIMYGVEIHSATSNVIGGMVPGAGNVIAGWGKDAAGNAVPSAAIRTLSGATQNTIEGNLIGTNAAGDAALTNYTSGIVLEAGANTVGGTAPSARNVISGNTYSGVLITSENNIIQGNTIGTDISGTKPIPNEYGLQLSKATGNLIGGPDASAGNTISGNGAVGVLLINGAAQNTLEGNLIGTQSDGTNPLGNLGHGILILSDASNNRVGGVAAGARNIIAYNGSEGIFLQGNGTGNRISGNSIFANDKLGVNLDGGVEDVLGVTSNDPGDTDTGPNNLQNFPILSFVEGGEYLSVDGSLNSTPNSTFTIEFFSNPQGSFGSGRDGKTFLGWAPVTTDAGGNVGYSMTVGAPVGIGQLITATATAADGSTSEFSAPIAVTSLRGAQVVTNTQDSGPGSFRQAILNANARLGKDSITFNIPGSGPHTIMPVTTLPALIGPVVIDGFTQPGSKPNTNALKDPSNATLKIVLDGHAASGIADGIWLHGGTSCVRGLAISSFTDAGVRVDSLGGNVIEGNYIGTDCWGLVRHDNGFGVWIDGVPGNLVGGTTPEARNVISGNSGTGVAIHAAGATGNIVQGNYIGVNANGTDALGNVAMGVSIYKPAWQNTIGGTTPGAGNVISGNGQSPGLGMGIQIVSSENTVAGNLIGTNAAGDDSIANFQIGIFVGGSRNTIGGNSAGARNIISGNALDGLQLYGDSNLVQGNYIGTDALGASAVPNLNGVRIQNAKMNQLGGAALDAANVISGNHSTGVIVVGPTASHNVVAGNKIGTDANGSTPLGNTLYGLVIINEAHHTTIGGMAEGAGNTIAFSRYEGIAIDPNSTGNRINRNSIYGNGRLGINLIGGNENAEGVTSNDLGDGDSGANNLQNFPLVGTVIGGSYLSVSGLLNSMPNATFRIEFFATPSVTPIRYGEGKAYLGWIPVTTDAQGDAPFELTIGAAVGVGQTITATATDADGNTSEFGIPLPVTLVEGTEVVTNTLDSGPGSLRQAMLNANAKAGRDTIAFNIPGTGVHTISPVSPLPAITDAAVIDGYTQPGSSVNTNAFNNGSNAVLKVEIDGTKAGYDSAGLNIQAGNTLVRGLVVNRFYGLGIQLQGNGGDRVEGCFIGTDAAGQTGLGNSTGIYIYGGGYSSIGGTAAAQRNVISGNHLEGVHIRGTAAAGNSVQGNYIGVTATGSEALRNGSRGVDLNNTPSNAVGGTIPGAGNVISGTGDNQLAGVAVSVFGASARGNSIVGNLIGTNASGDDIPTNLQCGVEISDFAKGNVVGGTSAGARNVISGNGLGGVRLLSDSNMVRGNYIGTDISGKKALPNAEFGVWIGSNKNQIGGVSASAGNVISGNEKVGLTIASGGGGVFNEWNKVVGNRIGTQSDGASPLPNSGPGILIKGFAWNNTIGDTLAGAGNIIAYNADNGIRVVGTTNSAGGQNAPFYDLISGNSIYANDKLGIDLVGGAEDPWGTTANDPGDADGGPNHLQNYPVLLSAEGGNSLTLRGNLNSKADARFTLEFFATPGGSAPRYGEGQTYLGWMAVRTDPAGNASFLVTFDVPVSAGRSITATATDTAGNTSEFSMPLAVTVTGIETNKDLPREFVLMQNYPNPFNPSTVIRFGLPSKSHVCLTVFNTLGQQIAVLYAGEQQAGYHEVTFDASGLSCGVYFYRLQTADLVQSKKLILLK